MEKWPLSVTKPTLRRGWSTCGQDVFSLDAYMCDMAGVRDGLYVHQREEMREGGLGSHYTHFLPSAFYLSVLHKWPCLVLMRGCVQNRGTNARNTRSMECPLHPVYLHSDDCFLGNYWLFLLPNARGSVIIDFSHD
jgi:hypothetical protein